MVIEPRQSLLTLEVPLTSLTNFCGTILQHFSLHIDHHHRDALFFCTSDFILLQNTAVFASTVKTRR